MSCVLGLGVIEPLGHCLFFFFLPSTPPPPKYLMDRALNRSVKYAAAGKNITCHRFSTKSLTREDYFLLSLPTENLV